MTARNCPSWYVGAAFIYASASLTNVQSNSSNFNNPTQIFADDVTEERGENARLSAFVGAIAVGDLVKSTLGPKGMDKILQSAYVSCDGEFWRGVANLMSSLDRLEKFLSQMMELQFSNRSLWTMRPQKYWSIFRKSKTTKSVTEQHRWLSLPQSSCARRKSL